MFGSGTVRGRGPQLPAGLFETAPGPVLAAYLQTLDVSTLSGFDLLNTLTVLQRMVSHYQARVYETIAAVAEASAEESGETLDEAQEAAALELRAAMRWTRRAADIELDTAFDLYERLPAVGKALASGAIDLKRARVLVHGTEHLPTETAREIVYEVMEKAPRMTTGQLAAQVRKLCVSANSDEAVERYESALDQRRLVSQATVDGTANLFFFDVAPDRASEAYNRVNHLALSLKTVDEPRTMDQLRVDVALDLLAGRADHGKTGRGTVSIHVDLKTLAELDENPGELAGYGPVVADIARQVTEGQTDAEWRYQVTDPVTGQPIQSGTTKRRHNAAQRRAVELRDQSCVFPGCRVPATDCDIDHTKPWAETHHTSTDDSAPLCRHDHTRRHRYRWVYKPLPGGDYQWTSLLGHTYTTSGRPPPNAT